MTITEIHHALGQWSLRLDPLTPRHVLDELAPFGHVAIVPGRTDVRTVGDNLLSAARYVGVLRGRVDNPAAVTLNGCGMAFWLGDEDSKGDVFVNAVSVASASFANAVRAVLPNSGAVVEGTLHSIPGGGTFTSTFQWTTPRSALTYIVDTYSTQTYPVSWRVNGDGTLDAGRDVDLFVTDPVTLLVRKDGGRDPFVRGLKGRMELGTDAEDYTTVVVLLAQGEGAATVTASASQAAAYLDIHGNDMVMVRMVSESDTTATNAAARAQLQLNRYTEPRPEADLSTSEYDVSGDLAVGDVVGVFDPDIGFADPDRQMYWQGVPVNPLALKVTELTWPVPAGWTVAYRSSLDGAWTDLSDYYIPENASTLIRVGDLSRALSGISSEPVGTRPVADTSTPATPEFTATDSVAYQSQQANDTRAALYLAWDEPLNADGSTVLDGDHYEVRIRATETFSYQIPWSQAAQHTWDELQTWGRPLSNDAADAAEWKTYYVGWNTEQLTIAELMVAAEYEIQIRAVDNASPPNQSAWSDSTFVTTRTDTLPPAQPAVPEVASSRISILVTHRLGDASGGTFNLARDLHHLEVHAGPPAFFPDESTHLGNLSATENHLAGQIPAVGVFPLENTDDVWVKVVAVDRFGNRSGASEAVQASADLIDSAHISDLTADKITAGTITASILMGARIATALDGARVELNSDGVVLYDANGEAVINITAAGSGNYLSITDGTDSALATIDADGVGTFQEVSADDMNIAGESFLDDYYDPLPKGIVARGYSDDDLTVAAGATSGYLELAFTAEAGRIYQVGIAAQHDSTAAVASARQLWDIRDGGESEPTVSTPEIASTWLPDNSSSGLNSGGILLATQEFSEGLHRLLWTLTGGGAAGNYSIRGADDRSYIWVEDKGDASLVPNTAVANTGGGAGSTVVTTYTRTYQATWFQTYQEDNTQKSDTTANQGRYSSLDGNQRSLVGFDYAAIRADLAGATIVAVKMTAYAEHWYYNAGGTAVIGTHNYTSKPSTWADSRVNQNRQTSSGWARSAKRTVTLSTAIGDEFKAGTTNGIAFGPGPSTDLTYYGKFSGSGSNRPSITITYTK